MEPTIYLTFNGTCLEAMRFYEQTLGGEITGIFRNSDAPDAESRMQGSDDMVLNMSMRLGTSVVMASDARLMLVEGEFAVMGFFVVSSVHCVWATIIIRQSFIPHILVFSTMAMMTLAILILISKGALV